MAESHETPTYVLLRRVTFGLVAILMLISVLFFAVLQTSYQDRMASWRYERRSCLNGSKKTKLSAGFDYAAGIARRENADAEPPGRLKTADEAASAFYMRTARALNALGTAAESVTTVKVVHGRKVTTYPLGKGQINCVTSTPKPSWLHL